MRRRPPGWTGRDRGSLPPFRGRRRTVASASDPFIECQGVDVAGNEVTRDDASSSALAALRDGELRWVNHLLLVSAGAVAGVAVGRQVPEPFEAASELGTVTFDLGVAYIAGWIFYYLTAWRPRTRDRLRALPMVAVAALHVARPADYFLGYMQLAAGRAVVPGHVADALTSSQLGALLSSLDFGLLAAPAGGQSAILPSPTLAERLTEAADHTREACVRLDRWSHLVDVELLALSHAVLSSQILNTRPHRIADVVAQGSAVPMIHTLDAIEEWFRAADKLKDWLSSHSSHAVDGERRSASLASRLIHDAQAGSST